MIIDIDNICETYLVDSSFLFFNRLSIINVTGAMVDVLMPFLRPIKSIVLRIDWRSDILIQDLKQPVMLISGDRRV